MADWCGGFVEVPVTSSFLKHTDFYSSLFQYNFFPGWMEYDFHKLEHMIKEFKQKSSWCFCELSIFWVEDIKCHAMDHILWNLQDTGSIQCNGSNLYKFAHCIFKVNYIITSKFKTSAMDKTINTLHVVWLSCASPESKPKRIHSTWVKAVAEDWCSLISDGVICTINKMDEARGICSVTNG